MLFHSENISNIPTVKSEKLDSYQNCCNFPMLFYNREMCPKDANKMINNVDHDQKLLLQEQSDLGLHCLPKCF